MLAIALVINEQSYLEQRVIRHPSYQKTVLQTIEFKLQDVLRLNQIVFPYYRTDEKGAETSPGLVGLTLHQFASLHERIVLGKRLYAFPVRRDWIRTSPPDCEGFVSGTAAGTTMPEWTTPNMPPAADRPLLRPYRLRSGSFPSGRG